MAVTQLRWATALDGERIAYEVRAERQPAPAVLALHGVLVGASNWIHQVLRLPDLRWIVPHLRGHGLSPPPVRGQTIEAAAYDALAVLDAEGIERSVVLGNSLGATVGLALALLRPDRVRAMVLVEASVPSLVAEPGKQRLRESATKTRELLAAGRINDALALFLVPRLGEDWERRAGRRRIAEWRRNIVSVPAWIDAVLAYDPSPVALALLDCPTLLVYGAETQRSYREMTLVLAELLPAAELIEVAKAGHGVPADNPDAFNAILVSFLDQLGVR